FDHHIKDVSQSAGSQRAAPVVDPECSAVPDRPPVCLNVVTKGTRCLAAERDNSFFAPLAMDFDERMAEVDVRNVQTQKLRGADAGCIEQFQKGEISNIHARSEERRVGKHCARRWGSKQCITEKS